MHFIICILPFVLIKCFTYLGTNCLMMPSTRDCHSLTRKRRLSTNIVQLGWRGPAALHNATAKSVAIVITWIMLIGEQLFLRSDVFWHLLMLTVIELIPIFIVCTEVSFNLGRCKSSAHLGHRWAATHSPLCVCRSPPGLGLSWSRRHGILAGVRPVDRPWHGCWWWNERCSHGVGA